MFIHDRSQAAERAVSRQMAAKVVNALEVIEVQQQQGERALTAFGAEHFALEAVHEFAIICQTGQGVVACLIEGLFVGFFAAGDVQCGGKATDDFAGGGAQRPNANLQNAVLPGMFEMKREASQGVAVFGDGRGVAVGTFQEFAEVLSRERAGANLYVTEPGTPVRGDA